MRAREGTGDVTHKDLGWEFDDEDEARGMVERLTGDGRDWRDMTESYLRSRQARQEP